MIKITTLVNENNEAAKEYFDKLRNDIMKDILSHGGTDKEISYVRDEVRSILESVKVLHCRASFKLRNFSSKEILALGIYLQYFYVLFAYRYENSDTIDEYEHTDYSGKKCIEDRSYRHVKVGNDDYANYYKLGEVYSRLVCDLALERSAKSRKKFTALIQYLAANDFSSLSVEDRYSRIGKEEYFHHNLVEYESLVKKAIFNYIVSEYGCSDDEIKEFIRNEKLMRKQTIGNAADKYKQHKEINFFVTACSKLDKD